MNALSLRLLAYRLSFEYLGKVMLWGLPGGKCQFRRLSGYTLPLRVFSGFFGEGALSAARYSIYKDRYLLVVSKFRRPGLEHQVLELKPA